MSLKCPGCQSPLHPSSTSCNVCLRNRTRQEMFRGMRDVKDEESRSSRRPLLIAAAVLILGVGGFLLWSHPDVVARWKTQATALWAQPTAPAATLEEVRPAAPLVAAAPEKPMEPQYTTVLPTEYRKRGQGFQEQGEAWTIQGLAYDLLNLQPAAGAVVTFTDKNSGKVFKSNTNVKGRYTISLPPLAEGGYDLAVRHKLYRENFLDDMEPPYNHQSRARREEAAQLMQDTAVLHVPVLLGKDESALNLNLVLLPKR